MCAWQERADGAYARGQLDLTYEDVGNPDPDPTGIGRSYDLTIQAFDATPSRDEFAVLGAANVRFSSLSCARYGR